MEKINKEKGYYTEVFSELKMSRVKDIDAVIRAMCIAFDVDYVNKDVYNAIVEDYINKKEVV